MLRKLFGFIKTYILYIRCKRKYGDTDFFQYEKLAHSNFVTPSSFTSVFLYGNYKAVAHLKKFPFNFLTEYLEHGISFYESIESVPALGYVDRKSIRKIYTYGEKRKRAIENYLLKERLEKKVISVGPYIKGSKHFYSFDKLDKLKSQYGKILLVFPMHSVETAKAQYDQSSFINAIEQIREIFDSVFVCLYWKDIVENFDVIEHYKKQNYIIVCNGHRGDPRFLSRQKDLIHLSDMVMTNALGTYIGYAICMNKPVYYYSQKVEYNLTNNIFANFMDEEEMNMALLKDKLMQLFGQFSFEITEEQITFVKQYWGEWSQ